MAIEKAYFAGGCFWHPQAAFDKIDGVVETFVGYAGGETENPTYEQVCRDDTGHAETVEVVFDSGKISYRQLLDKFFEMHDPTQVNKQGLDVGKQYRSAVFYTDDAQRKIVEEKLAELKGDMDKPVATEVAPLDKFYKAEEYHQKYYEKHLG